jgi:hypothetical protein
MDQGTAPACCPVGGMRSPAGLEQTGSRARLGSLLGGEWGTRPMERSPQTAMVMGPATLAASGEDD